MSISERLSNISQALGITDRPPSVESVNHPMVPTASPGDDGGGWYRTSDGYQRDIVVGRCPGEGWQEGSPGVWHKK